jgi:hypothetical protein
LFFYLHDHFTFNILQVIHIVADGFSQMFTLAGIMLGIPVVGSFHTDIIDLLNTHGAYAAQMMCVLFKEAVDSLVLDSCATTSSSFMVSEPRLRNQLHSC